MFVTHFNTYFVYEKYSNTNSFATKPREYSNINTRTPTLEHRYTLNNLTVELSTRGDLKLIDRPQNYTVAAGAKQDVKTSIKVSSTWCSSAKRENFNHIAFSCYHEKNTQITRMSLVSLIYITRK